jgi:hypothetical protein
MYRTYNGKVVEFNGQQESIYKHLKNHGSLSQLEALGVYGIYRLAARVCEMRRKGVPIDSENKTDANGKVYASYFINPEYKWRTPVGSDKVVNEYEFDGHKDKYQGEKKNSILEKLKNCNEMLMKDVGPNNVTGQYSDGVLIFVRARCTKDLV